MKIARAHEERRNSYRTALGFKFMTHVDTSEARAEVNVASMASGTDAVDRGMFEGDFRTGRARNGTISTVLTRSRR